MRENIFVVLWRSYIVSSINNKNGNCQKTGFQQTWLSISQLNSITVKVTLHITLRFQINFRLLNHCSFELMVNKPLFIYLNFTVQITEPSNKYKHTSKENFFEYYKSDKLSLRKSWKIFIAI